MRRPILRLSLSLTHVAGASAMAAVLFEAVSFARSARQVASIVLEQVAWQPTGAGADSARN
eukprot:3283995-Alexandrium_andersonii.AAC.1